jgi:starch-binding outer membrane protein, SusD/RagB family
MLKMNIINKIIMRHIKKSVYILLLVALASCSDDFLDLKQTGVQSEETFYSSIENLSLSVTGTYATLNPVMGGLHNIDVTYVAFGSIASDDAEAGGEQGGNDFVDIQDIDKGTVQPTGPKALIENYWGYSYKSIMRANAALLGIQKFRSENGGLSATDEAKLNQFEGEMLFILAFTHFRMTQIFGGIPIVDHLLGADEYALKRNTIAECLHFIETTLDKAIPLLPLKSQYTAADIGRITKGAAQSLLAKAYLYEASYAKNYSSDARFTGCTNKYAEALTNAENVITSGEYKLIGIDGEQYQTYWNENGSTIYPNGYTPAYRYIFTVDGENSPESIFEIQSVNDGLDYMYTRGTYLTIYMAVRNFGTATLGWGFNCPTQALADAYEVGDPRKLVSIGEDGDAIYVSTGWSNIDCMQSPTNKIGRKFDASPAQYWDTRGSDGNGPNNFPYIRYGDVVLMAAEAAVETGDAAKALTYVNMIRKRARNNNMSAVPADLTSCTFEDVVKERRLELAMEGHRFFDLVRWKKQDVLATQTLQPFLGKVPQTPIASSFTSPRNDFFPLPLVDIINSNYSLEQYPGW